MPCRPSARLGEVEAVLALSGRQPQLLLHDLLAGVVRQLEIVGAGHHAGQVVVRVHLWRVERFLHDGERRQEAGQVFHAHSHLLPFLAQLYGWLGSWAE